MIAGLRGWKSLVLKQLGDSSLLDFMQCILIASLNVTLLPLHFQRSFQNSTKVFHVEYPRNSVSFDLYPSSFVVVS